MGGAQGAALRRDPRGADGDAVLSPRITRNLVDGFARVAARRRHLQAIDDPLRLLSRREREVFDFIATGLDNAEIASELHLSEATVKTRIRQARDLKRVQVVIYAYDRGLR